jgi:hypothetical protein
MARYDVVPAEYTLRTAPTMGSPFESRTLTNGALPETAMDTSEEEK